MSADNFYVIRKDTNGKFVAAMGFASDYVGNDEPGWGLPDIEDNDPKFDSLDEALEFAVNQYSEYGVSVDRECEPDPGEVTT